MLSIYRAKLTHNARLYVQQGAVHIEYLNHLYSVFQNLCSSGFEELHLRTKLPETCYTNYSKVYLVG
jgi:hypothetical protein